MAFFKKLKERLFKSSSKIDEGLEAIVEDGGEVAEAEADLAPPAELAPNGEELRRTQEAERAEQETAERQAAEERAKAEAAKADAERARVEAERREHERVAEAERQAQAKRDAEERARVEAARIEEERLAAQKAADVARIAADQEDQRKTDEAAAAAEAARLAAEEAARAQAERIAEDARRAEEEAARIVAEQQAARQKAEDDARAAEEAAQAAQRATEAAAAEQAARKQDEAEASAPDDTPKRGLLGRLFGRREQKAVVRRVLDDDMLEQLEELLITADMGVDTALRVTANMAEGRFGKKLSVDEIKQLMASEIARIMEPVAKPLPLYPKTPQVVLVVGVNGSGKTTTIGKLASQFRAAGKKVVIAAGDTVRAAAVEQLQVWGDRAGVPVLTAPEGSDPASLAFDAMSKAQADGADLLMIDTAGRLQNRSDLMEELAKIVRVIRKHDETAPHNTLLVLDATTGQNALSQVKIFQEVSDVSGLVMTKLDGTAKGGVHVALADKFGLPIHAIGLGEQIDDLAAFDPEEFAAALTGLEAE